MNKCVNTNNNKKLLYIESERKKKSKSNEQIPNPILFVVSRRLRSIVSMRQRSINI